MNWYKKAKLNKESKIVNLDESPIPSSTTEALKLKDGNILYDYDLELGHWGLLEELIKRYISLSDFESVGFVNTNGKYSPFVKGDKNLYEFFGS